MKSIDKGKFLDMLNDGPTSKKKIAKEEVDLKLVSSNIYLK